MRSKIAILSGGTGRERDIALKSVNYFRENIGQDHDFYILPEQLEDFIENKDIYKLAIPIFHGEYGEDGCIFAFLDILGIPHALSSYDAHSLALNKYTSNLFIQEKTSIPKQYLIQKSANTYTKASREKALEGIDFPLIIKPNKGGSSYHTYKVEKREDYDRYLDLIETEVDDDILVQAYITADEYSVGVVAGQTLPIMKLEKKSQDMFFDYESKYESEENIKEVFPDNIDPKLKQSLEQQSLEIYKQFNIKGFCRIDYLVDRENNIYFLEINTIPGMSPASIIPKAWEKLGGRKTELVQKIIQDR